MQSVSGFHLFCVCWCITNPKFVRYLLAIWKAFVFFDIGGKGGLVHWVWIKYLLCLAIYLILLLLWRKNFKSSSPHELCLLQLAWHVSASKTMTIIMKDVLLTTLKLINFIRAKALNHYLFSRFSQEMETEDFQQCTNVLVPSSLCPKILQLQFR